MKFFQFLVATEAFMPKPGNKQFTMDNIDYNPQRDGKRTRTDLQDRTSEILTLEK